MAFVLRAPKFEVLDWSTPLAMGWLYCDNTPCCERGSWTGFPYLLTGRPLREAARKWYQARIARCKREEVRFFEGVSVPTPQMAEKEKALEPAQKQTAPRKAATKKAGATRPGR